MADIRPLDILFIHPTYTFGGAERTAYNLIKNLDPFLFRLTFLTSKKVFPRFSDLGISRVVFLEEIGMKNVWFGGMKSIFDDARAVAGLLRHGSFDIAFGMMHYASALLSLSKIIYRVGTRIISSPRGPSAVYLQKFITNPKERMLLKFLFSLFCRFSDCLIVTSQGMKDDCVQNFGAKTDRVTVIPNSVDAAEISRMAAENSGLHFDPGLPVVSAAGRLSVDKNFPLLLKACAGVMERQKVKLLIIGDGPERERLKTVASDLKIADNVLFIGYQENPYKYIALSDLFVHTCLVEGFGNAIIEAMACRVPVIATSCPYGPGEIISDGEDGILVPVQDADCLCEAIVSLLGDGRLREELSAKGYRRALDFPVGKMAEAYQNCFLNIARI